MNPNAYTGGNHQSLLPHEHIPKKKKKKNVREYKATVFCPI